MNTYEARVKPLAYWFGRQTNHLRLWLTIAVTVVLVFGLVHRVEKALISSASTSREATKQSEIQRARMSDEITIHAAGRGNPWINLSDGHELITPYSGPAELTQLLDRNEAHPLSLCSADFDEDGVPDLISGYAAPNGGIVTLLRGNVDSIYPNAPEAKQRKAEGAFTDAPFLSPAFVFSVPEAADFIGAGDFDGDGHWDVVTAARGSNKLYLMSGDGKGGLRETKRIDPPGGATAMVVGEINRSDGLDDIVVGVSGERGSKALVFEGPEGALRASPEILDLPAEASSMALGQLDNSYEMDLAIAAGRELMIVHGRDRRLSLDKAKQAEVMQAHVERREFSYSVKAIALGDFRQAQTAQIGLLADDGKLRVLSRDDARVTEKAEGVRARWGLEDWRSQLLATGEWSEGASLVTAKVSSTLGDNLVVVDSARPNIGVIADGAKGAAANEAQQWQRVEGVVTADLEIASALEAVLPMRLNSDALSDLVVMRKGNSAPGVISTAAAMTFVVTNINDSGPGTLRQAILDANANPGADTITFSIGSGAQTIKPTSALPGISDAVTIDATTQSGFSGKPLIELNGVNASVFSSGLRVNSGNTVVRGLVVGQFAAGGIYIFQSSNTIVEGNFIGTTIAGTSASGNVTGIAVDNGAQNLIGGTAPSARNVISANTSAVAIQDFNEIPTSTNNQIIGNFIGTDTSGAVGLGNKERCITVLGAINTKIGGTSAGTRNVIAANDTSFPPPPDGFITSLAAVRLMDATGTLVQNNIIGADITGANKLGNNTNGVIVLGSLNCLIGGTTSAAANIISGNREAGIILVDAFDHQNLNSLIQGNLIGTDITGSRGLGNNRWGVVVSTSFGNTVGGDVDSARNVISGNTQQGILIGTGELRATTDNTVQRNYIGTGSDGIGDIGNGFDGIFVSAEAISNTILGNRIAFNKGTGVRIPNATVGNPGLRISILGNSIFSNEGGAIDLGPAGVASNDDKDPDFGANELQNFPLLASSNSVMVDKGANDGLMAAAIATVRGTFNSTPNQTFTLQFFFGANCGGGSGHQFTGAIPIPLQPTLQVTTDSNGNAPFVYTFEYPTVSSAGFVNSTATNSTGNTSETSACIAVTNPNPLRITSACKGDGKQLIISGSGFVDGAKVFINGEREKKTQFVSSTQVIALKAGKRTFTDDRLKVRNPDGTETSELTYTRVDCPP